MEELVLGFGCDRGPRNPSVEDVKKAMDDIAANESLRPEFSIENASNWKSEVVDGRLITRVVMEGKSVTIARFYPESSERQPGWNVVLHDDDCWFILATYVCPDCELVEGYCCGGPLTVRANCIVSSAL